MKAIHLTAYGNPAQNPQMIEVEEPDAPIAGFGTGCNLGLSERIIISVLWIALQWLLNLLEAIAVIAVILAIGAAIAVSAFWLLYRIVCKLAGSCVEAESYEYDMDGYLGATSVIPLIPDDPRVECTEVGEAGDSPSAVLGLTTARGDHR
jgi:hypothetical protein